MQISWFTENLTLGMHTVPAAVASGEQYAAQTENLRPDGEGALVLRYGLADVGDVHPGRQITGVVGSRGYLLYLLDDGTLWYRRVDGDAAMRVEGIDATSGLSGRLSLITAFEDYLLLTSEGDDQGFWIDRSGEDLGRAEKLGLDPPPQPPAGIATGDAKQNSLDIGYYVFAFTYARAFWRDGTGITGGKQFQKDYDVDPRAYPFLGMESNPGGFFLAAVGVRTTDVDVLYEGQPIPKVHIRTENGGVALNGVAHASDAQATGMYVYRSDPILPGWRAADATWDVKELTYRVVDFLRRGETAGTLHSGIDLEERPVMDWDNERLPASVKQWTFYNDRLWGGTGTELRYSDVRNGDPHVWAFPAENAIPRQGDISAAVAFYGVLLFGGRNGLWRLTGTDIYNFDVDQVSGSGPVDGYAIGLLDRGLGMVGETGLFLTDATQLVRLSDPVLEGVFENQYVEKGAVVLLPNGESLWAVQLRTGDAVTYRQFQAIHDRAEGGTLWFGWSGVPISQAVSWLQSEGVAWSFDDFSLVADDAGWTAETLDTQRTDVMIATGSERLQVLVWDAALAEERVAWSWKSQQLSWRSEGVRRYVKQFRFLTLLGAADEAATVSVWVEGELKAALPVSLVGRLLRIPIFRRARDVQFEVSGTGPVTLEAFRVKGEVFVRDDR